MFIFGFSTVLFCIISCIKVHCIPLHANFRNEKNNSSLPPLQKNEPEASYDIRHWVYQMNSQQCAFVEIGERFCAIFVELRSRLRETAETQIAECFLEICDSPILRSWKLYSSDLFDMKKSSCISTEATATANKSATVQQPYSTEDSGLPTYFLNPLPKSICSPRRVCGVAGCTVDSMKGIHLKQCDPNFHQKQLFCEHLGSWTSVRPRITSLWSKWSIPKCIVTCGRGFLVLASFCDNQVTARKAIDCIGPGSFCCLRASEMCECKLTIENDIMKARRYTKPCTSCESCLIIINPRGERRFLPESTSEESRSYGVDDKYEEFEPEHLEDKFLSKTSNDYAERGSLYLRRLLQNLDYDINNYEIMKSNDDDKEFNGNKNNDQMVAIDEEFDDNDIEYDPDIENSDDEVEDNDAEEQDNDEEDEDDMISFGKTRERSNHIHHDRVLRSGDEATFTRQPRFLGWPFSRKKLPKENYDCEDPSVTEQPIYRDYDPADSSGVPMKPQISSVVLTYFIASFTMFLLG